MNPSGALDAMTRDLLHDELESVWRARGLTVLFVTHNVREAVRLADRVDPCCPAVPGRVVQEYRIECGPAPAFDDPAVGSGDGADHGCPA
jgi:NitT/TauT family transport system ATP-binding protein